MSGLLDLKLRQLQAASGYYGTMFIHPFHLLLAALAS
jgi:hypothetical protein